MLVMLTAAIPLIVISILGLYFAITRRKKHPRASTYAIAGFSLLLLYGIQLTGWFIWIASAVVTGEALPPTYGEIFSYLSMAGTVFNLAGLAFVARAVFVDRSPLRSA